VAGLAGSLAFSFAVDAHRKKFGFLIFSHARVRPLSYRERMRFTMHSSPKPQSLAAREARPGVSIQNQELRSRMTRCKCSKIGQSVAVRPQLSNSEAHRRNLPIFLDRSVLPSNKLSNNPNGR